MKLGLNVRFVKWPLVPGQSRGRIIARFALNFLKNLPGSFRDAFRPRKALGNH
jgi:hypothetical protein